MEETRMKMRKKAILVSALLASLVSSGVMADQAADIQEAKDNAAQALEKVNEIDKKIQPMQTDLEKYKGTTDELKTKLKEYDTVTGNAAKAAQHDAKIAELTGKVSAAEQKVDTQLEAFRNVGNGVKDIANAAKQKADEAKQKADEANQKADKVGDLEKNVTQIDTTVKSHNEEITKIKDGNQEFQEGIADQLRQAKKETDTRVDGIDNKVKTVSDKADALDHKIDNTKTDLEATIKTVDEKVTKLNNPEARIKEVEKTFGDKLASMEGHTNKGLAKVTALSGLHPLGYDAASKWNISVATGHYKSENAIAMGAFFQPNRHVLLSFAGTVSGGDDAYTVGASIRVGRSGHKEMSGAAEGMISATEFYDIVGKLQDEIARQRQEIEALKNR